jgi:hypothetical protein
LVYRAGIPSACIPGAGYLRAFLLYHQYDPATYRDALDLRGCMSAHYPPELTESE